MTLVRPVASAVAVLQMTPIDPGNPGVVLLNSGGIDSRISAAILRSSGQQVHSLHVAWNRRVAAGSAAAAAATAAAYCVDHTVVPWGVDWTKYLDRLQSWGQPFTNLLAISMGASFAGYLGVTGVASGIHATNSSSIAAANRWRDAMMVLLDPTSHLTGGQIGQLRLLLPVFDMSDEAEAKVSAQSGVDLSTTWSCPVSDPACGTCYACKRRARFLL